MRENSTVAASAIWFKSERLTPEFLGSLAQIQLCTVSRDQGWVDSPEGGNWTWFEIVVMPDASTSQPKCDANGKPLAFISHYNRLGHDCFTRNYGFIFDRQSWLLRAVEPGDVLAVRACARFVGWQNRGVKGFITVRRLHEDPVLSSSWKLPPTSSSAQVPTQESSDLDYVSYTVSSITRCFAKATDDSVQSTTWFSTPPLDQASINALESVQLFTLAYRKYFGQRPESGHIPAARTTWFEIACLNQSDPLSENLVEDNAIWHSHDNHNNEVDLYYQPQMGRLFDASYGDASSTQAGSLVSWTSLVSNISNIKYALKPGCVIAVRICAQHDGWENYGECGYLVLHFGPLDESDQD